LIADGSLFRDLGLPRASFDAEQDRVMLCGSMGMIRDAAAMLEAGGLREGSNADPGDFVIERAFVG
jgi:ferredoxin/flavodoxin---NADP+ reductase